MNHILVYCMLIKSLQSLLQFAGNNFQRCVTYSLEHLRLTR